MNHVDPITTAMLEPAAELQPARLVLTTTSGSTDLDGVWWPRSDSLHREVPFLDVAVHDATRARIARLSYTVGTWDEEATVIWTPLGLVKVGWFITSRYPRDVDLVLTDGRHAMLRVIAASTPAREGTACLRLAEESQAATAPPLGRTDAAELSDPDPDPDSDRSGGW